jgi:hypothetical protein
MAIATVPSAIFRNVSAMCPGMAATSCFAAFRMGAMKLIHR